MVRLRKKTSEVVEWAKCIVRVAGMRWCGSLSGICGIRTNSLTVVLPVVFHKMLHALLLSYRTVFYCSNYHISCTILCNRLGASIITSMLCFLLHGKRQLAVHATVFPVDQPSLTTTGKAPHTSILPEQCDVWHVISCYMVVKRICALIADTAAPALGPLLPVMQCIHNHIVAPHIVASAGQYNIYTTFSLRQ